MAHPDPSPERPAHRPLATSGELQAFYREAEVVDSYLRKRTSQPLNGVLHRGQVVFLNRVVAERRPARVLEIAPGPARLTAELEFTGTGMAIDASPRMLAAARARLAGRPGRWLVARGDAFALPAADRSVDFVYTVKFVRHFQRDDRARLYAEIRRVLRTGGTFAMDAQNRAVSLPHRRRKGLEKYPIYDVLYELPELVEELEAERFRVVRVAGLIRHFAVQSRLNRLRRLKLGGLARLLVAALEWVPGSEPSTWMVLCEVRE